MLNSEFNVTATTLSLGWSRLVNGRYPPARPPTSWPFSVTVELVIAASKSRNTRIPWLSCGASKCLRYTHTRCQADGSHSRQESGATSWGRVTVNRSLSSKRGSVLEDVHGPNSHPSSKERVTAAGPLLLPVAWAAPAAQAEGPRPSTDLVATTAAPAPEASRNFRRDILQALLVVCSTLVMKRSDPLRGLGVASIRRTVGPLEGEPADSGRAPPGGSEQGGSSTVGASVELGGEPPGAAGPTGSSRSPGWPRKLLSQLLERAVAKFVEDPPTVG